MADDMRYCDLSSYNSNSAVTTTNINALAVSGMRFTNAHTMNLYFFEIDHLL